MDFPPWPVSGKIRHTLIVIDCTMPYPSLPIPASSQDPIYWRTPTNAACALALTRLISQANRPVLILARSSFEVARLNDELCAFGVSPTVFPDWETLPYDRFSRTKTSSRNDCHSFGDYQGSKMASCWSRPLPWFSACRQPHSSPSVSYC